MSTLNGPIRSKCSVARTYLSKSHFQCTQNRKNGIRVRINITTHQKKKEYEEMDKREEEEEERKQSTIFRENAWCPCAVVQR